MSFLTWRDAPEGSHRQAQSMPPSQRFSPKSGSETNGANVNIGFAQKLSRAGQACPLKLVLARPGFVAAGALEEMPRGCFSALVAPEIPLATSDAENALAPRRGGC